MTIEMRVRKAHRWLSIVFTATVIANFAVLAMRERPMWVVYSPLPFLFLQLFSGLYLFVRPYFSKSRNHERA